MKHWVKPKVGVIKEATSMIETAIATISWDESVILLS